MRFTDELCDMLKGMDEQDQDATERHMIGAFESLHWTEKEASHGPEEYAQFHQGNDGSRRHEISRSSSTAIHNKRSMNHGTFLPFQI